MYVLFRDSILRPILRIISVSCYTFPYFSRLDFYKKKKLFWRKKFHRVKRHNDPILDLRERKKIFDVLHANLSYSVTFISWNDGISVDNDYWSDEEKKLWQFTFLNEPRSTFSKHFLQRYRRDHFRHYLNDLTTNKMLCYSLKTLLHNLLIVYGQ